MQVPAPVEYERATSLDHALQLLQHLGPESRIIAGGHSLLPMMKLRLLQPEVLIDINDLSDLDYIKIEGNEMQIGAMSRHASLLSSALVAEHFPIIVDAEKVIADPIVRNRGTVGGSLCQADPSEDLSAVFSALRASLIIQGSKGSRVVSAREFHTGPYSTVVAPNEILVEVRVPIRTGCGSAYEKVERRVGDWAIAAAGAVVFFENGKISDAGIGLTAVGAEHFNAPEAETLLIGKTPNKELLIEAGALAASNCHPSSDQRGPEDYKRYLVGELTTRALARALNRASGGAF